MFVHVKWLCLCVELFIAFFELFFIQCNGVVEQAAVPCRSLPAGVREETPYNRRVKEEHSTHTRMCFGWP
jgi:hypothetical protein